MIVVCLYFSSFTGFFVGFVVDRFGTRACGVVGCFVTTIATGSCYFAKSTLFLIIVIGTVAGNYSKFRNFAKALILRNFAVANFRKNKVLGYEVSQKKSFTKKY